MATVGPGNGAAAGEDAAQAAMLAAPAEERYPRAGTEAAVAGDRTGRGADPSLTNGDPPAWMLWGVDEEP